MTVKSPAFPPASRKASFSALTMLCPRSALGPCNGMLEKTVSVLPCTLPPRLESEPQATGTRSVAAITPTSAVFEEGILTGRTCERRDSKGPSPVTAQAAPILRWVKIGILTAGGDCPGLNAVIRAVTRSALAAGDEPIGLWRGYAGLAERDYRPLDMRTVSGILPLGGTILSTSSFDPFREPDGVARVMSAVEEDGFDAIVAIGGEHTMDLTRGL